MFQAAALFVEKAKIKAGERIIFFGGLKKPMSCFGIIAWNAQAFEIS